MDEKMRLIAALASEEDRVTELCEEFSISRKTAYKWWARYRQEGPAGLKERSHTAAGGAMDDNRGPGRGPFGPAS
jgi:transposase-like protein